ncbi:MAG: hypothetical protein GF388_07240 [Candidatus Aegiribacteria sp.]|nr:hypothetical protein [Candidatus Aegiribacteria sp.]MBD3294928.1 hypothetical protein [Candidatus Fermentibacteria bacterium]
MGGDKAVELRHEGKTYRAPDRKVFFQWAREHRISIDDSYRVAGTDKWIPVTANNELKELLDPDNWWKVTMGEKTYIAPDWETIVKWAKDGRLSVDVRIEGPKTPPGGILGKASPEISPYLREWVPDDPERQPVRLRFDGRTYIPGDLETLKKWISESRVPPEAEVSLKKDEWTTPTEIDGIDPGLWPDEASTLNDEIPEKASAEPPREEGAAPPSTGGDITEEQTGHVDAEEKVDADGEEAEEFYRITTTYGEEYVFQDPSEVRSLLKRKRINSFDEIRHPDLPDGSVFVSEFLTDHIPGGSPSVLLIILAVVFGAAGAAAIVFQRPDAQWMFIGGIASLVVALLIIVRLVWKR